jgi:hypothetical protein
MPSGSSRRATTGAAGNVWAVSGVGRITQGLGLGAHGCDGRPFQEDGLHDDGNDTTSPLPDYRRSSGPLRRQRRPAGADRPAYPAHGRRASTCSPRCRPRCPSTPASSPLTCQALAPPNAGTTCYHRGSRQGCRLRAMIAKSRLRWWFSFRCSTSRARWSAVQTPVDTGLWQWPSVELALPRLGAFWPHFWPHQLVQSLRI